MTSKTVAQLLADLGVLQSHCRPHVSNDNPFSEANFKTLKYSPRSRSASPASPTPEPSATGSSTTTTTSTATPASAPHPRRRPPRPTARSGAHRQAVLDLAYTSRPPIPATTSRPPNPPEATWINPPGGNLSHTS